MSHDASGAMYDELINPMPLISNLFKTLEPVDNESTARFLERFGNFMKREPDTRSASVTIMETFMPELKKYYDSQLAEIAVSTNEGSQMYRTKKSELDKEYAALFPKLIEYAKIAFRTGNISLKSLYGYIGKELTQNNHANIGLSRQYISELLTKHLSYRDIIAEIEKEVEPLIAGDFKGNRETNRAGGDILYGNQANPKRVHFDINKGSNRRLAELLREICRYTKDKPGIAPQYVTMSKQSEHHIESIILV